MNIDLWSIGWHMLSVFFLALLFKHFLFKPVRAFMDNNAKKVMEDRQQLEVGKRLPFSKIKSKLKKRSFAPILPKR